MTASSDELSDFMRLRLIIESIGLPKRALEPAEPTSCCLFHSAISRMQHGHNWSQPNGFYVDHLVLSWLQVDSERIKIEPTIDEIFKVIQLHLVT